MKMGVSRKIALSVLLGLASPSWAESLPGASATDSHVRVARWVDGQVYRINVAMMRVTSVEFEDGEEIVSIIAGDTEGFMFDGVPGGQAFVVKPKAAGASTNITVYTNKRSYYFSVSEGGGVANYAVRFTYPGKSAAKAQGAVGVSPIPTNVNYGGDKLTSITPRSVFDDGTFTYFIFDKSTSVPGIFKVADGKERSVNSTVMEDGSFRVSGTSRYWVLRLGNVETTIADMGK